MGHQVSAPERWVKDLPASKILYPKRAAHRAKYVLWRMFRPVHPMVRNAAERIGIRKRYVHHPNGRQNFLIGRLKPGVDVKDVVMHLVSLGYGNHFIAWRDNEQVVSLRLLDNFTHQYHLRIFKDGEVRGHYEYTPECYPFLHLRAVDQTDRRNVFYKHLGDFIDRT